MAAALWNKTTAKERDAFNLGAQSKRGGTYIGKGREWYLKSEQNLIEFFERGFRLQQNYPTERVTFATHNPFRNDAEQAKVAPVDNATDNQEKEIEMKVRTTEEIEALKEAYRTETYNAYADEQRNQGFEPQDFEEAFSAHLAAIDAADTGQGDGAATGTADAGKQETAKERKAREAAERKAKREADKAEADAKKAAEKAEKDAKKAAEKAEKEAKAKEAKPAKAKKFRPTSEDRVAVMDAAKKLVPDGETPRMKLTDGQPYDEFLKGVQMDADGNATIALNVFTAKALRGDKPEASGQLSVTIAAGKLTKVAKA